MDDTFREVDFGFMDVVVRPTIVPPGMEHSYVPVTRGLPQEARLKEISAELADPLGYIAAMCVDDREGKLLIEDPVWLDGASVSGDDGYVLRGMLK